MLLSIGVNGQIQVSVIKQIQFSERLKVFLVIFEQNEADEGWIDQFNVSKGKLFREQDEGKMDCLSCEPGGFLN